MRGALTVLTYHRVLPEPLASRYPYPSLAMPEPAFERQVGWLAQSCAVLPVGEALEAMRAGPRVDRPLVSITFDDGYEDNLAAAAILERRGLRATFFVTLQPIEKRQILWFDRAAALWVRDGPGPIRGALAGVAPSSIEARPFPGELPGWIELLRGAGADRRVDLLDAVEGLLGALPAEAAAQYRLMTAGDVVALSRKGHEVASHTLSHPFLTDLTPPRLREELTASRAILAGWLGREVDGFCYPAGDHDGATVQAVRAAGYRYACTTEEGANGAGADPFRLRRIDVTADRATRPGRGHDAVGFRMEVSGLRHAIRNLFRRQEQ